jgi:hypothetical protein
LFLAFQTKYTTEWLKIQAFISFYPLQNIKDAKIPTKIRNDRTFSSKVIADNPVRKRHRMFPVHGQERLQKYPQNEHHAAVNWLPLVLPVPHRRLQRRRIPREGTRISTGCPFRSFKSLVCHK